MGRKLGSHNRKRGFRSLANKFVEFANKSTFEPPPPPNKSTFEPPPPPKSTSRAMQKAKKYYQLKSMYKRRRSLFRNTGRLPKNGIPPHIFYGADKKEERQAIAKRLAAIVRGEANIHREYPGVPEGMAVELRMRNLVLATNTSDALGICSVHENKYQELYNEMWFDDVDMRNRRIQRIRQLWYIRRFGFAPHRPRKHSRLPKLGPQTMAQTSPHKHHRTIQIITAHYGCLPRRPTLGSRRKVGPTA